MDLSKFTPTLELPRRGGGSAARTPAMTLIPAATSFDFLEGTFRSAQRARQVFLTFALAIIAGVGALVLVGVMATVQTATITQTTNSLDRDNINLLRQIAARGGGGVSSSAVGEQITKRETTLKAAITHEVDVPRLLNAVQGAIPPAVKLTSVEVGTGAGTAPTSGGSGSNATPAPKKDEGVQVTITANVRSLQEVDTLKTALSGLPELSGVSPTWSGSVPELTVVIKASATPDATTARSRELTGPGAPSNNQAASATGGK